MFCPRFGKRGYGGLFGMRGYGDIPFVYGKNVMKPQEAGRCCGPIDEWLDAELFKALGEPTRLKLLSCLAKCGRACSVTEMSECCLVDFSVVSRHLSVLEKAGVLTATKEGRTVFYAVRYQHLTSAFRSLAKAIESSRPKRSRSK